MDEHGYIERGKQAIIDLLAAEHAAVWPEIEAKIAERQSRAVWPHILTKSRQALHTEGRISSTSAATRGGRQVLVWHLSDLQGRERAFLDAAGRKRLLYARFLSWHSSRRGYPQGLVGPAAEAVLHASLLEAAPYGYKLAYPAGAQVRSLLGSPVAGGPLSIPPRSCNSWTIEACPRAPQLSLSLTTSTRSGTSLDTRISSSARLPSRVSSRL